MKGFASSLRPLASGFSPYASRLTFFTCFIFDGLVKSRRKPELVIPVGRAARFHRAFEEASIRMPNTDLY
jgi:hypothetical protein